MSARTLLAFGFWRRAFAHPEDVRAVRYAVGATLAMAVAMGHQWELSYLVPVLSLSFLANPATRPDLKQGVSFVLIIGVACYVGLLLGRHLTPYPLVYVPFSFLVLLWIFHAQQGGRSPLLITWLLVAVLVVPLLALQAQGLANFVAAGIVFGAGVTVLLVWIVYFFIPEPEDIGQAAAPAPKPAKPLPSPMQQFENALLSTSVVFPVMVYFYMFNRLDSVLILIFIAILAQQTGFAKDWKIGKALIAGNVMGGAVALVFYELLVMIPEFVFLLLLTLLVGLICGTRVFSGKPTGALWGMAFSTLLLVIGSVTSGDGEAGSKVYTRVLQIIIAVSYVVLAFSWIDAMVDDRRARREAKSS